MRYYRRSLAVAPFIFWGLSVLANPKCGIPANHPFIQYFGRWDWSDSLHPKFSWPGVYLVAEFNGTSVGIRLDDHTDFFNVYIDGTLCGVLHGTKQGEAEYSLVEGLESTRHTLFLSRRNITFDEIYAFGGIILDSGATLLPPPPRPFRKIEFIGDSFTAAESNEAMEEQLPWEARFPVTNIDKGSAAIVARHFGAEYMMTCRSGSGMVCDWQGNRHQSIPIRFDRTFMDAEHPKWDFSRWVPDVVALCLGLNDHSGLRDTTGNVSIENSGLFRSVYHRFCDTIRVHYPGVRIVAVAPFPAWIRSTSNELSMRRRRPESRTSSTLPSMNSLVGTLPTVIPLLRHTREWPTRSSAQWSRSGCFRRKSERRQ